MEKKLPKKKKILIIDDEQDITEMLSSFFQSRGYEAITAGSASQALRQVETRPDLILLDINMPGEDGFSLCGNPGLHQLSHPVSDRPGGGRG